MATEVKRRRGTTAQHEVFEGAEAELTVDTDKWTVLVHDDSGSAPTGHELLRQDFSNVTTLKVDTTYSDTGNEVQGEMYWNSDEETVSLVTNGQTIELGQKTEIHVRNNTGSQINKGEVVYASGTIGNSGRILITKMIADGTVTAKRIMGVAAENIANSTDGKIITFGKLKNINTSSFSDGDILYASATTAGALQNTEPSQANGHVSLPIAYVIHAHSNGQIFIRVTPIDENEYQNYDAGLADIAGLTPTDSTIIVGNGSAWVAESGATARTSLGLGNVENTALSTYTGQGGALDNQYITNGAGYTTNVGDITGVTAGNGLSGGGTSGAVTLAVDFSELPSNPPVAIDSTDQLIWYETGSGTENRTVISSFPLSAFDNDSSFINQTNGDGRYLQLTGGTISGILNIENGNSLRLYSPSDAYANADARNSGNGARIHRFNKNSTNTGYLPYYENWYDGSSYHSIGVENDVWQISDGLDVSGRTKVYSAIGASDNVRTGLAHYDTTAMAANVGGQLVLGYKYDTGGTYTEGAILKMYKENGTSGQYGSGLKFQVRNHGANLSTKMILDPSGNVGINTIPSSSFKLDVNGAGRFVNDLYADEDLVVADNIYLSDTNTKLTEGNGDALRMQTTTGYVDIGSQNSSYLHLQTDRDRFYFNKQLVINTGIIESYDEDLQLRRAASSSDKLTIKDNEFEFNLAGATQAKIEPNGKFTLITSTTTKPSINSGASGTEVLTIESGNLNINSSHVYIDNGANVDGDLVVASSITSGSFVKDGGSSSQFLKADGSVDSNTYLTSGSFLPLTGGTLTGNITIGKADPVLILNDTSASNSTVLTAFTSYRAQGSEKGFVGYGSGSNNYLYVRNSDGRIDIQGSTGIYLNSDTTLSGDLDVTGGAIVLEDSQPIKWDTNNILSHNGTSTYLGDAASASTLTLSGGNATLAGDLEVDGTDIVISDSLILGEDAYNASANYVGMKTSFQTGTNDYMIISGKSDGNTYLSARAGSNLHLRGGGNDSGNEIIVYDSGIVNRIDIDTSTAYFNGNVGIGTTSPSTLLDVRGEVSIAQDDLYGLRFYNQVRNNWSFIGNDVSDSSSANLRFGDATGEVMRITGGNVGIGETNPLSKVHIEDTTGATLTLGNSQSPNDVVSGTVFGRMNFYASDRSSPTSNVTGGVARIEAIATASYSGTSPSALLFYTHDNTANDGTVLGNPTERMRIDSSGNLTLGNSAYGSSLGQLRIINDASSNPASLSLFGYSNVVDNGNYAKIDFAMQTSGTGGNVVASIRGLADGTGENASDLVFYTATGGALNPQMTIDSSGLVGIGETNPDRELDLKNSADNCIMSITSSASHLSGLVLGDTADDDRGGILYNNTSDYLYFLSNAQEAMRIDSTGNVNIYGTDNRPLAITSFATVSAGAGWDLNATSGNGVVTVSTGGTERMRIDSSGDLTMKGGRIIVRESDDGNDAVKITRDADEGYVQLFSAGTQTIELRGNGNSYFNGGNLLVGKTTSNYSAEGVEIRPTEVLVTKDGGTALSLQRLTNDGTILSFAQGGSSVGSIGTFSSDLYIGTNDSGLRFEYAGTNAIVPFDVNSVAVSDNATDLGASNARFKDLYLGGDANIDGDIEVDGITDTTRLIRSHDRNSSGNADPSERYPIGHHTLGEEVFSIDPTWSQDELRIFFNSNNVSWLADSDAPSGYAIKIDGTTPVGGEYGSGFPYIPVYDGDVFYMEYYIKTPNTNTGIARVYVGSNEYNQSFSSLGGNPGSYGYWVNSGTTFSPNTPWQKRSGYIKNTGGSNVVGEFESGIKYWTPMALWNYQTGSQDIYISGWRVIRVKQDGNRFFSGLVGIGTGTTTPSRQLHVNAGANTAARFETTADVTMELKSSNSFVGIEFDDSGGTNEKIWYNGSNGTFAIGGGGSNVTGKKLHIDGGVSIGSSADNLSVPSNGLYVEGNVGIGIHTPATKLHLTDTSSAFQFTADTGTAGDGRLNIGHFSNGTFIGTYGDDGGAADVLRFGTHSGDERMRITSGGDVEIGTTTNAATRILTIDSSTVSKINLDVGSEGTVGNFEARSGEVSIGANTAADLHLKTSGTDQVTVDYIGNVGIGVTSTSGLKTLIKGATGYPATSGTTQTGVLRISGGTGLYNVLDMGVNETTDVAWMQATRANTLAIYDKLAINPYGGNVGIGTTSPLANLHIEGANNNDTNDYAQLYIKGTGAYPLDIAGIVLDSAGSNQSHLRFSNNGSPKFQIRYNNGDTADDKLKFYSWTQTADIVTFDGGTGNVGIGTTSPSTALHIDQPSNNRAGGLYIERDGSNYGLSAFVNSGGYGVIGSNGNFTTDIITMNLNNGNVGIGATDPKELLHIYQQGTVSNYYDEGALQIGGTTNSLGALLTYHAQSSGRTSLTNLNNAGGADATVSIGFGTINTSGRPTKEVLTVTQAGNVGIGTISPASGNKLHVVNDNGQDGTVKLGGSEDALGLVINYDQSSATTTTITSNPSYTNTSALMILRVDGNDSSTANQLVLKGDGKVGIGTDSPSAKLDTRGSISAQLDTAFYRLRRTNGTDVGFITDSTTWGDSGTDFTIGASSSNLRFYTNNSVSERMRIDSSGQIYFKSSTDYKIGLNDSAGTNQWWLKSYTNGDFAIHENGVGDQFTIQAGGNVGIGNTSPSGKLQIDNVSGNTLVLRKGTGTPAIAFGGASGNEAVALLEGISGGGFKFYTATGTLASPTYSPRMVLNSSGNVGIGTTGPSYKLHVKGVSAGTGDGDQIASIGNTTGGTQLAFGSYEDNYNWIRSYESGVGGRDLVFAANSETMRITSSGNVSIADGNLIVAAGHGVDFSANQNNSGMTSELLDDYEEGTFTPTIHAGASNISLASNNYGKYTKVGNVVHCSGRFQASSLTAGSSSTNVELGGLPFTCDAPLSTGTGAVAGSIGFAGGFAGEAATMMQIRDGETNAFLYYQNSSLTVSNVKGNDLGSTTTIVFQITYQTAS